MSIETSLSKYTNALDAIKQHEESNKPVFEAHKKLLMSLIDAENELRDDAAGMTEGLKKNAPTIVANNGQIRVIVTLPTQKVYAEDTILAAGLKDAIKEQTRPPQITISEIRGQALSA